MADKAWKEMTADERRASRLEKWRNPGIEFDSPEAEATFKARCDRLMAAWELREPDRVPININAGWWMVSWGGITPYDAMHDTEAAMRCWLDFNETFQPDTMGNQILYTTPASVFESIDYKLYEWPGHGVAREASYQYNEKEWMLADEYDHLISDPSDYLLRAFLPRTVGAFAGFANTSSLLDYCELPFVSNQVAGWGSAEMAEGLERLAAAARAVADWHDVIFPTIGTLMARGWPGYIGGASKAPFDILGDTLRGTREVIIDMYRRPEKVVAACERLVPVAIDWALKRPGGIASPVVFLPLHKGADGFMSDEQFHTFYWPTLRAVLLGLIEEGCIPFCFAEGRYGSRLEAIMDLPKGKTIWAFDQTDMAKAKKTIGQVACIQGNVPLSLMHAGTPEEVVDYVRNLIDVAGEGGGYIVDVGAVSDSGKEENLKAMVDTAKEYGRY
jgi:Uroporphyrinogen decarboxylase (URO-D)